MSNSNSANGDADCIINTGANTGRLQRSNTTVPTDVPLDNRKILSTIVSDTKKLNDEIRAIMRLKSELKTSQGRPAQTTSVLQKPAKGPGTNENKSINDLIRSDIEKLNDDLSDITILKSELTLYQHRVTRKLSSFK